MFILRPTAGWAEADKEDIILAIFYYFRASRKNLNLEY
jgi:hypothetical protein